MTANSARSPEDIEVTPEMIEAGVFELSQYDPEKDNGYEFVKRVFQVMAAASPDGGNDRSNRLSGR